MKKTFAIIFLVLVLVLSGSNLTIAQTTFDSPVELPIITQPTTEVPTLTDALASIRDIAGLGIVISFLFAEIPFLRNLSKEKKRYAVLGLCIGLPLLSQAILLNVPEAYIQSIEPYWKVIALGFLAWTSSQIVHIGIKNGNGNGNGNGVDKQPCCSSKQ